MDPNPVNAELSFPEVVNIDMAPLLELRRYPFPAVKAFEGVGKPFEDSLI